MSKKAPVTKILIVDDHAVVRSGLRMLLDDQDDLEVVGEAGTSGEHAVVETQDPKPDVILMDMLMPADGIEATAAVLKAAPRTRSSSSRCRTTLATCTKRSPPGPAATCSRRRPTPSSSARCGKSPRATVRAGCARRQANRGTVAGRAACGRAVASRARGRAATRTRPCERGDREHPADLSPHRRDASLARHAEARPRDPRRARRAPRSWRSVAVADVAELICEEEERCDPREPDCDHQCDNQCVCWRDDWHLSLLLTPRACPYRRLPPSVEHGSPSG